MYSKELADMGVVIFRRQNESGGVKPHLCIRFKSEDGRLLTFAIDTTRFLSAAAQPDAYLITHAHSDHYGKSAMLSKNSRCSLETAKALEIRYDKTYKGCTFKTGETTDICGVPVRTFDVCHAPGSAAFYWVNDVGTRILVTGDVKDASALPECDILITEASYGDPADLSCYFRDDIAGLHHAVLSHIGERPIAFGAYEFGKSQKAVSLIRAMGYNGPIAMTEKTILLTAGFLENAGDLVPLDSFSGSEAVSYSHISYAASEIKAGPDSFEETVVRTDSFSAVRHAASGKSDCRICIVPIHHLPYLRPDTQKYVLTCRTDYPFENIRISDHLDVNGLTQMVRDVNPKITVVYHPNSGLRTDRFAKHLERNGYRAFSINQIKNIVGNGKQISSPD